MVTNEAIPADIYSPSLLSGSCIRLLRVPSLNDKNELFVPALEIFEIQSCPPYIALSYTWGTDTPTEHILIGDQPFSVRSNLYAVLEILQREQTSPKISCQQAVPKALEVTGDHSTSVEDLTSGFAQWEYIWIDNICIDQDNIKERNHQVSLMRDIYSSAVFVMVWLGLANSGSARAMEIIRANDSEYLRNMVLANHRSMEYYDIQDLLQRTYWTRLWVVQEFLLGRDVLMHCGHDSVDWVTLRDWHETNATRYGHKSDYIAKRWRELCGKFSRFVNLRQDFRFPWLSETIPDRRAFTLRFEMLLSAFKRHGCSDPRDRVYGMLALLGTPEGLKPDYQKSVEQLHDEVLGIMEQASDNLKVNLKVALGLTC